MSNLDEARKSINEIDKQMAPLFEARMDAVGRIADYKREHGLSVEDSAREQKLRESNCKLIRNDDYKSYYVSFQNAVMDISKSYQHRLLDGMRIAFSGAKGAFADITAAKIFPDGEQIGFRDFKAAYDSVARGECDSVVLPLENSVGGDVGTVMDLCFFGTLFVNGIYETEIIQNLIAIKGTSIGDIKTVVSHPQALSQCSEYIRKNGFETMESVNTAVAAKYVSESKRGDLAAIGSAFAAKEFGLSILESHINESGSNTTRFAVLSRAAKAPDKNDDRFILLFTVKNIAGALGKAVSIIGEHGFNLRALKSRPTKELVWNYYFYAEGEGNINSDKGKKMLSSLKNYCLDIKVLGSFEKEIRI
ncbi:MAG: chorismate mutase [Clostridia bacterium]|nr:chorismate mutase [Clostridia bacterium]